MAEEKELEALRKQLVKDLLRDVKWRRSFFKPLAWAEKDGKLFYITPDGKPVIVRK